MHCGAAAFRYTGGGSPRRAQAGVSGARAGGQERRAGGAKIYAIRPGSLLARLGFANGDTVLAINKRPVDSPDDLLDLHAMFRDTKLAVVDLERRGKPVMMMFKVTQ